MNPLVLIWTTACGLALGALLWMTALIVMRVIYERRSRARAVSRCKVETALISILRGREEATTQLAPFAHRARLMAEVVLEFLAIVRGHDQERVLAALRALGVDATLRRRLGRGSLAGRLVCLEALAAFPGPETRAALEAAASSRKPRPRLVALRSLAGVGGDVTLDRLLDDLLSGALRASGLLADFVRTVVAAEPGAAMQSAGRADLTPAARAMVLDALGEAGDYGALPLLIQHAAAPEATIRVAAVQALGRLRHPAAEPTLRAALSDEDSQVRAAASEAAGSARLGGLAGALGKALADPVWRVRFQAAAALAKLGPGGLAFLRTAADSPVETASVAASLALAERAA